MARLFVLLFAIIFAAQILTGCGQRGEQKVPVIKPEGPVAESNEEQDTEEDMESEEALPAESAPKTITESAVDKAEAIQKAQEQYGAAPAEELIIANFNSGEKPNNIGGNFGAWNKDPSDPTQWCRESFDNVSRHGDSGFSMKLDYSVDSPNPAYNGFWMMLPNFDASKYDVLNLWVKGDAKTGYTTVFKIELKNATKQIGRYYITSVSDQWQEVSIPLSEFRGLIDRTSLTEFVVVFEDRMASNKKGVIYIDDIRFIKK
jgi:hypothetical protein